MAAVAADFGNAANVYITRDWGDQVVVPASRSRPVAELFVLESCAFVLGVGTRDKGNKRKPRGEITPQWFFRFGGRGARREPDTFSLVLGVPVPSRHKAQGSRQ